MLLLLASDASDSVGFSNWGTIRLPRVRQVDGLSWLEIGDAAKPGQVRIGAAKAGEINHKVFRPDI